jgi:hypothetical protein
VLQTVDTIEDLFGGALAFGAVIREETPSLFELDMQSGCLNPVKSSSTLVHRDTHRRRMATMSTSPQRWSIATVYPDMWVDPDDDPRNADGHSPDGELATLAQTTCTTTD